jgi:hypothetical protein
MAQRKWKRCDLAIYQGGIARDDLTEGDTYVVNAAGQAHGHTYLQIVTDDREVVDLLSDHFKRQA